jgi:hypothetical protein
MEKERVENRLVSTIDHPFFKLRRGGTLAESLKCTQNLSQNQGKERTMMTLQKGRKEEHLYQVRVGTEKLGGWAGKDEPIKIERFG